jgi:hypothetical protein
MPSGSKHQSRRTGDMLGWKHQHAGCNRQGKGMQSRLRRGVCRGSDIIIEYPRIQRVPRLPFAWPGWRFAVGMDRGRVYPPMLGCGRCEDVRGPCAPGAARLGCWNGLDVPGARETDSGGALHVDERRGARWWAAGRTVGAVAATRGRRFEPGGV